METAGRNMAGADEPYDHLPFFYSDLFELGYEAIGEVDPRRPIKERWVEPGRKGIVAYLSEQGAPRGFLFWDVWGKTGAGEELIAAGAPLADDALDDLLDG